MNGRKQLHAASVLVTLHVTLEPRAEREEYTGLGRRKFRRQPSAGLRLLGVVIALLFAGNVFAEDVVIVATGANGEGRTHRTGEIVDYTGHVLTLRTAPGADAAIPAERVIEVQTAWTPPHRRGDELFAEGKFAEALQQYREAAAQETRPWVRRRLIAQAVWCYRYLGQPEFAAGAFLTLAAEDPATQSFEAIPLAWTSAQPDAAWEGRLRSWLTSDNDLAALIAASWLLTTGERATAADKLRDLSLHADPRIALLAEAQRWRTQQATATKEDVARWEKTLDRLPESLRAGAYFLIGQSHARLGESSAALTLLRVPVLYPQQRELAAESLLAAARMLERLARSEEAQRLYQELTQNYPESPLVDLARQGLERLNN